MVTLIGNSWMGSIMNGASYKPSADNLKVQFTRNKNLIRQYAELRKNLYQTDPRFVGFRLFKEEESENYEDYDDQMVVLTDGMTCYGGACLRISTPERYVLLDLENDIPAPKGAPYFSLRAHFPKLELFKYSYAEISRVVLLPEFRNREVVERIFKSALSRCIDYRVRYLFGLGDIARIRLSRHIYGNMGVELLCHNIDVPQLEEYEGIKMHLLGGDLRTLHITEKDPNASKLLKPIANYAFFA